MKQHNYQKMKEIVLQTIRAVQPHISFHLFLFSIGVLVKKKA